MQKNLKIDENTIQGLLKIAKTVKFGELVIKIQDSNIVHIEKKERFQVRKTADPNDKGGAVDNFIQTG